MICIFVRVFDWFGMYFIDGCLVGYLCRIWIDLFAICSGRFRFVVFRLLFLRILRVGWEIYLLVVLFILRFYCRCILWMKWSHWMACFVDWFHLLKYFLYQFVQIGIILLNLSDFIKFVFIFVFLKYFMNYHFLIFVLKFLLYSVYFSLDLNSFRYFLLVT